MVITPRTDVGRVTVIILRLNIDERLLERQELHKWGLYPGEKAVKRVRNM